MSPNALVQRCLELGLNWIAITDHNSMANCPAYEKIATQNGIAFSWGVEIQTSEEIHILAYFEDSERARHFDKCLYESLLPLSNDPDFFGDQVVIDENESIISVVEKALINSSMWSLEETVEMIRQHQGYCVPAHIDATINSIISQLGFIADPSLFDAFGITAKLDTATFLADYPGIEPRSLIRSSDAHYLSDLGSGFTSLWLEKPCFAELILAIKDVDDRKIVV